LRLVDLQANPKSISHQPKHNSRVRMWKTPSDIQVSDEPLGLSSSNHLGG
jgi:hypothetical protein